MEAYLTPTLWLLDVLLTLTLVGLAVRVLTAPDLFQAIVWFIVFGLIMAIVWTRLQATDIALAEAAIGAGLTGALFLNTLGQMHARRSERGMEAKRGTGKQQAAWAVIGLFVLALSLPLGDVVWRLPRQAAGLGNQVEARLAESGANNPVTAVLLNFRGYDTFLEIGVLLLAVVGVWSLPPTRETRHSEDTPGLVLLFLVRILVPIIGVVAAYLLWQGTDEPGGAFQAGAVLSAAGVLLLVAGLVRPPTSRGWAERGALVLGFGGFLALAVALMGIGGRFLEYPPTGAASLILLIETVLTLSIALTLVALFAGGAPAEDNQKPNTPHAPEDNA
ncbi:MAG: hydrogenase subunit MbhD domain-containing protein [Gemmataceae bacterium]